MIYTSYFSNWRRFPKTATTISICGKAPNYYYGLQYKKLAPKIGFFMEWKENGDNDFYIKHFNDEVLSKLNPEGVIKELKSLSQTEDIILLCYEKPSDFCHRHIVAEWLSSVEPVKEL